MKVLVWTEENFPSGKIYRSQLDGINTIDEIILPGFTQGTIPKTFDKFLSLSVPGATIRYKHEELPELAKVLEVLGDFHRETIFDAILFALEKFKRSYLNTHHVDDGSDYQTTTVTKHKGGVFDITSKPGEITVYLF